MTNNIFPRLKSRVYTLKKMFSLPRFVPVLKNGVFSRSLNKQEKGFAPILIIIVIVLAIGGIVVFMIGKAGEHGPSGGSSQTRSRSPFGGFGKEDCKSEFTKFGASPLRIDDISYIVPMGRMSGEHVTPTDHQYFHPPAWNVEPTPRDVIAPGDGFIVKIERLNFQSYPGAPTSTDYNVTVEHSCTVSTIYIHITEFSDRINEQAGNIKPGSSKRVRIPVTEGEVMGLIKGFSDSTVYQVDFLVIDTDVTLPGFITPSLYEGEPWKIHTVDPFDYFAEPVRSQLLAKNLRTAEPLGGKIDYDIDGKLVGNWFQEGTGGYAGFSPERERYWETNLAIAYDHIYPTHVVISIGSYEGRPAQFGVRTNSPDPSEVGVGKQVKYELMRYEYYIGDYSARAWDRASLAKGLIARGGGRVEGVILLELIENRKLKVEVFPGKSADQVSGFTSAAKIYER